MRARARASSAREIAAVAVVVPIAILHSNAPCVLPMMVLSENAVPVLVNVQPSERVQASLSVTVRMTPLTVEDSVG